MEVSIQLNDECAHQLAVIQKYTNQDCITVIQQGISLYYQQLQPHCHVRIEVARQYDLVCNVSPNTSLNN